MRSARPLGRALLVALVPGCGSAARPPPVDAPPGAVSFVIENTQSPGRSLSITLESATGDRLLLGAVGPRRTETFVEEGLDPAISYRLVAGPTGGRDVASERFTIRPGSTVRWTLPANSVRAVP